MDKRGSEEFDAIVVGSGPGGGSVAGELSKRGWNLLVLEKGSAEPIRGTTRQTISMTLTPGKGLHITQEMLGVIQGVAVGGSTIPYYACAFDPPYEMFDSYDIDLRPEVAEIKRELPTAPLSDDLVGPAATRIMESAQDLGYDWKKIPKLVYQEKCRPNCDKCSMGCPYGAKWTSRMVVEEICQNGSSLVADADVKRVLTENRSAVGVEYVLQGKRHQAFAKTIIISAGGIGTPQILRRSGITNVGADFFFDPLVIVMGVIADLDGGKESPMAAGLRFGDEGYLMTDLASPRWLYWLWAAEVFRFDQLGAHKRIAPIMVKARDELGGHITGRGAIRKRLGDVETRRLMRGYEKAKEILTHAGAETIFKSRYMAAHPGGTAKINDVVDSNLQTEIDDLFVCDCSVIPEAWGLPPTITLLALGKRLGKHLAGA
jgi:choline dehydrogenase-like flavoprotein